MENGIFAAQKSGKRSLKVKWEKNAFRTVVVVVCALIAWFGAADLDKFVSLIGSLAWCVFRQFLERKRTSAISLTTLCSLLGPGVAQRPARVDLPGAPALEGVRPQPETKSRRYRTHRVWGRRDYLYHQADGAFVIFPCRRLGDARHSCFRCDYGEPASLVQSAHSLGAYRLSYSCRRVMLRRRPSRTALRGGLDSPVRSTQVLRPCLLLSCIVRHDMTCPVLYCCRLCIGLHSVPFKPCDDLSGQGEKVSRLGIGPR